MGLRNLVLNLWLHLSMDYSCLSTPSLSLGHEAYLPYGWVWEYLLKGAGGSIVNMDYLLYTSGYVSSGNGKVVY